MEKTILYIEPPQPPTPFFFGGGGKGNGYFVVETMLLQTQAQRQVSSAFCLLEDNKVLLFRSLHF